MTLTAAAGPLWAVTSYFNPVGYRRRRENFRVFRQHLALPLAAIELSFSGSFELQPGDAEILLQIHGRDVMWQKERLLNEVVRALPAACTQVAVIDCDVIFDRPDWPEAVSRKLADFPLVQPFSTVHYPPPDVPIGDPRNLAGPFTRPSVACLIELGLPARQILADIGERKPGVPAPGHALAARRELLDAHGLYDVAIAGGGDLLHLSAACGALDEAIRRHVMNEAQAGYYRAWAERLHRRVGGAIGCVTGELVHLWHGEMSDRGTLQRYQHLAQLGFNPVEDIDLGAGGCWRWCSDKPALHAYLRGYFASRKEDGREAPAAARPATLAAA